MWLTRIVFQKFGILEYHNRQFRQKLCFSHSVFSCHLFYDMSKKGFQLRMPLVLWNCEIVKCVTNCFQTLRVNVSLPLMKPNCLHILLFIYISVSQQGGGLNPLLGCRFLLLDRQNLWSFNNIENLGSPNCVSWCFVIRQRITLRTTDQHHSNDKCENFYKIFITSSFIVFIICSISAMFSKEVCVILLNLLISLIFNLSSVDAKALEDDANKSVREMRKLLLTKDNIVEHLVRQQKKVLIENIPEPSVVRTSIGFSSTDGDPGNYSMKSKNL